MTAVTQIIPNYLGGVSRQPDEKKSPGQVIEILNGYPDPTYGLTKRNGLEFVLQLDQGEDQESLIDASWFFISRDSSEFYYACVTKTGVLRVWNVLERREVPKENILYFDNASSYLENGLGNDSYEFLTVQDATFVVNKTKKVLPDYGLDKDGIPKQYPDRYYPDTVATVKCLTVEYNCDYELFIESPFFNIGTIKFTSDPQPEISSTDQLQTASEILQGLAAQIPEEYFGYQVLNNSLEIWSRDYPGSTIEEQGNTYLFENNLAQLVAKEVTSPGVLGPDINLTEGINDVPMTNFLFGNQWSAACIERLGGVLKLVYVENVTFNIRVLPLSDSGVWDGSTYESFDNGSTNYYEQEKIFICDFNRDGFLGNPNPDPDDPDEPIIAPKDYTLISRNVYDDGTSIALYKDQLDFLYIKDSRTSDPDNDNYTKLFAEDGETQYPYVIANKMVASGARFGQSNADGLGGSVDYSILYYSNLKDDIFEQTFVKARTDVFVYRDTQRCVLEGSRDSCDGKPLIQRVNQFEPGYKIDVNGDGFIGGAENGYPVPTTASGDSIESNAPFTIEAKSGQSGSNLDVYQSEVENAARLAANSIEGRRVKVINTTDDKSSYFVRFIANDPVNPKAGQGYWEEDIGWEEYSGSNPAENGLPYIALASKGVRKDTMPYVIKSTLKNTFSISQYPYVDRLVGSELSNPSPSFVDSTISSIFLENNRLGFLSNENVILSQSGEFGNFYFTTAKTVTEADPIDLNCSSIRPAKLHSVIPDPQGLILFSEFEQFMLFSESGTLTPSDSVIRSISNYESDPDIPPVDVGTSTVFLSKTPSVTKAMGMVTRGLQQSPVVIDIGKVVAEYIPRSIDQLVASPQNSFAAMAGQNHGTIIFYRFFNNGERDVMQAWFKWEVPGKVQSFFVSQDVLFMILDCDGEFQLLQSSLAQSPILGTGGVNTVNPRLDRYFTGCQMGELTYDPTNNRTLIPCPYKLPTTDRNIVYIVNSELKCNFTSFNVQDVITTMDINSGLNVNEGFDVIGGTILPITTDNNNWYINGDWTGTDANGIPWYLRMFAGSSYDFEVELPTTYLRLAETVSDYTASLTIARYRFSFGESSEVNFLSKARGSNEWDMINAIPDANYYNANTPALTNETLITVPIYQRNNNFEFKIVADTPLPVSINSMMWEGKYVPRNYRRA